MKHLLIASVLVISTVFGLTISSNASAISFSDKFIDNKSLPNNTQHVEAPKPVIKQQTGSQLSFQIPKNMRNKLRVIQWEFKAGKIGRPILSGNRYQLVNLSNGRGMKRQPRTLAANLGFLKPSSKYFNMKIQRQAGNGQVRYGDRVALHMKPYGWLRYKKQGYGINLSDDDHKPHYMWLVTGGKNGQKLVSGMPFALFNTTEKSEIVYCQRTYGIDLGWRASKCGGWKSKLSHSFFGANGLFSRDGISGKAFTKLKNHLCDKGIKAGAAYISAQSAGAGAAAFAAVPKATKECNKL